MITVDARVELFKKQFPKEKIVSVQEREGTDHSVIEINHTWMCKSSKTEQGVALLDREARLLTMLQGKIDTQIPVPVYSGENFLVYKKIPGSPLISYAYSRLGSKQRSKLIVGVEIFLSQLHTALTIEEIASLGIEKSDWPWSYEKLQAHRHHLGDNKDLLQLFDNIMNVYQEELQDQGSYRPVLIHNDMSFKNIIIDPLTGKLRGIIDFTDVAFDDPYFDLRMRRDNLLEFTQALSFAYYLKNDIEPNPSKLYAYYFATEFSRYFHYKEEGNAEQAEETLNGIVASIRDFLELHDDCDGESCEHGAKPDEALHPLGAHVAKTEVSQVQSS